MARIIVRVMDTGNLDLLPEEVLKEMLMLEEQRQRLELRDTAKDNFMEYVMHVYDGFIVGRHALMVLGPQSEVKDHSGDDEHGVGGTFWPQGS
jgi:hypothetical protein